MSSVEEMFFVFGNGIPLPVSFALLVLPYVIPYLQGGGLSAEDATADALGLYPHQRRTVAPATLVKEGSS